MYLLFDEGNFLFRKVSMLALAVLRRTVYYLTTVMVDVMGWAFLTRFANMRLKTRLWQNELNIYLKNIF